MNCLAWLWQWVRAPGTLEDMFGIGLLVLVFVVLGTVAYGMIDGLIAWQPRRNW